jgi:hypothetical protein
LESHCAILIVRVRVRQINLFAVCTHGCPQLGDIVCTENGTEALAT